MISVTIGLEYFVVLAPGSENLLYLPELPEFYLRPRPGAGIQTQEYPG